VLKKIKELIRIRNQAHNLTMMSTIAENCILRRDRSGSKKGKRGKQLQQQHDQQTWDRIWVMNRKSHWLV
jgi:hypothetical protein